MLELAKIHIHTNHMRATIYKIKLLQLRYPLQMFTIIQQLRAHSTSTDDNHHHHHQRISSIAFYLYPNFTEMPDRLPGNVTEIEVV